MRFEAEAEVVRGNILSASVLCGDQAQLFVHGCILD